MEGVGDGNCCYRAVMYGYLERVVLRGEDCIRAFLALYSAIIATTLTIG